MQETGSKAAGPIVRWIALGVGPASLLVVAVAAWIAHGSIEADTRRFRSGPEPMTGRSAQPKIVPGGLAMFWRGPRTGGAGVSHAEVEEVGEPAISARARVAIARVRAAAEKKGIDIESQVPTESELAMLDSCPGAGAQPCRDILTRIRESCETVGVRCLLPR